MDYKELIESLRDESNCNILDYIDEAADAIEILLAERESAGWISVNDRLPEVFQRVLTFSEEDGISAGRPIGDGRWRMEIPFPKTPTHWMPLPEPPDGDTDNG